MSSNSYSENAAHRAAVLVAESKRQAGAGSPASEIQFHRDVIVSAVANNAPNAAVEARRTLFALTGNWF